MVVGVLVWWGEPTIVCGVYVFNYFSGKEVERKFEIMGYNIDVRRIPSAIGRTFTSCFSTTTSSADAEVVEDIEKERTN